MTNIFDTRADLHEDIIMIGRLAGVDGPKSIPLFNGLQELSIGLSATRTSNLISFNPVLEDVSQVILIFEDLSGIDIKFNQLERWTEINSPKTAGLLTDSQLFHLQDTPLDHIAVRNGQTGGITRYFFSEFDTDYYSGAGQGKQLLKIMAGCIVTKKTAFIIQPAALHLPTSSAIDIVQFTAIN